VGLAAICRDLARLTRAGSTCGSTRSRPEHRNSGDPYDHRNGIEIFDIEAASHAGQVATTVLLESTDAGRDLHRIGDQRLFAGGVLSGVATATDDLLKAIDIKTGEIVQQRVARRRPRRDRLCAEWQGVIMAGGPHFIAAHVRAGS
jgi:hypothetical protein